MSFLLSVTSQCDTIANENTFVYRFFSFWSFVLPATAGFCQFQRNIYVREYVCVCKYVRCSAHTFPFYIVRIWICFARSEKKGKIHLSYKFFVIVHNVICDFHIFLSYIFFAFTSFSILFFTCHTGVVLSCIQSALSKQRKWGKSSNGIKRKLSLNFEQQYEMLMFEHVKKRTAAVATTTSIA